MANERKIISLLLIFTLLEQTIVETQSPKTENTDFLQYEAQIFIDNIVLVAATNDINQPALISNLVFQPKILDFLQRPIGDPSSQLVTLFNKHDNQSVYLGSISGGSTSDFYSSYFEEKVIPPQGNSTFQVVFLPRQIGQTIGSFQVHTSFGMLRYVVQGEGTECPYRLQPLVGLKAPLNATISPEILMYNPHDTTLQIIEIYSSGGNFQLELPSGGQEGPQALWEIPPHSTKPIIRVRFTGRSPGNHTAYVRIKISGNDTKLEDRILVVPIEIEILNHTGIYSKIPFIDLGVVGSSNQTFKYNFNLINSGNRFVDIKNWQIESDDTSLIDSITLNLQRYTRNENIADRLTMEIDWHKIKGSIKYIYGTIVINATVFDDNYGGEQKSYAYIYKIPFAGQIIKGHIDYNRKNVSFFVGSASSSDTTQQLPLVRDFNLKNHFDVPLSVTSLNVPDNCSQYFLIDGFKPIILLPGDLKTLFKISMREPTINDNHLITNTNHKLTTESFIKLTTNVSVYDIPIVTYASLLRRVVPFDAVSENPAAGLDEKEINFGILPVSTFGEMLVTFINDNPIAIAIKEWHGTFNGAASISTIPRGCGRADTDSYKLNSQMEFLMLCDVLQPGDMIVFQVSVLSDNVGTYNGKLLVKTDYEELVTPIKFTTAMGRLELLQDQLQFKDCFPGKVCSLNLHAYSTFMKKMSVEGVSVDNGSITYEYADDNEGGDDELPEIAPNMLTNIGRLTFDPRQQCQLNCYSSFDLLSKPFGVKWMSTLDNYTLYSRLDSEKLIAQLQLFNATREFVKNVSFRLTTTQVRRLEYNASINFVWPKLLTENIVQFPVIQVEQEAVKFITLHNPSDHLLFVHYILHDPQLHGVTNWLDQVATPNTVGLLSDANIIYPCENCSLNEAPSMFAFLFDESEIYVNYVKPKSFVKIGIKFTATMPGTYSTILYMRNNLTTMDAVWITAKAAVPQFKFGNRKPGSPTALLFEIVDKHTKVCEQPVTQAISTKRTFTARNYGEVPILISGILIDDALCEGYGFQILDCSPFELAPNASKKIEIAFAPDFTLARVTRTLYFDTDIGPLPTSVNFSLVGTIPPHALEPCIAAVVRPPWESKFKNVSAGVLTLAFVFVIIVAYFDSDRILKEHIHHMSKDKGPIQPPLDLRQIGLQQSSIPADTKPPLDNNSKNQNGVGTSNINFSTKRKIGKKLTCNGNTNSSATSTSPASRARNSVLNIKNSWTEFTNKLTRTKPTPAIDLTANKSPSQSTNKPQTSRDNNRTLPSSPNSSQTVTATVAATPNAVATPPNSAGGNRKKPKEKIVEEDALSTSTESSSNSEESDKSIKNEKVDSSSGKKTNGKLNMSLEEQQAMRINKINVKKTKSLPLSNDGGAKEGQPMKGDKVLTQSASKVKMPNGQFNGQHHVTSEGQDFNKNENAIKPPKKYGKTPGRERKMNSNQNKNTMNPNAAFKGSAFAFASPLPKSNGNMDLNMAGSTVHSTSLMPPTSNNIWSDHNNKISFSDMVAKKTLNDLPLPTVKSTRSSVFEQHGQHNKQPVRRQLLQDGGMMKFNYNEYVEGISQSSTDLGPIGPRKLPLVAPSWSSFPKPVPISQSHSYDSTSLFPDNFPQHNPVSWSQTNYTDYNMQPAMSGGDNNPSTNNINNNNNNNSYWNILPHERDTSMLSLWSMGAANMHQQQHQQQQQLQQQQLQQQHFLQQQMNTNNWSNNNNCVRPPPGFNNFSNEHQQDLHYHNTNNSHDNQEEINSQQQYQQQQQSSNSNYNSYDPFRSIQSLWDSDLNNRWDAPSDDKKHQ